jgi:hypothetical protein
LRRSAPGALTTGRDGSPPRNDVLALRWYDDGLGARLTRLETSGKRFRVTELANRHALPGGARIDPAARQKLRMTEMVAICERGADVVRCAGFTGRWSPDPHHTSRLGAEGVPSEQRRHDPALRFASPGSRCGPQARRISPA